jgi:hypothetical protein
MILGLLCLGGSMRAQLKPQNSRLSKIISLCEIIKHPAEFNGRFVHFRANAITDGFEYTSLVDPECNEGVAPWSSEKADKRRDVKAFNHAIESQSRGVPHQQITATFGGRFEFHPSARNPTKRRLFEIIRVEGLEVSSAPVDKAGPEKENTP